MTDPESRNPFALPGAEKPRAGRYDINGCRLYSEVRGHGPAILIIGAASDDAEMFRPIAERLSGFTVVTYDLRGTLRSSSDGWPCGGAQHADDAAELIRRLGLGGAHVFGASAGGIVALQLALRHPDLVRRVLVFEPGFLQHSESGRALASRAGANVDRHLAAHPGDFVGAMAALSQAVQVAESADAQASVTSGLLDAPEGLEWYAARGAALADNFVRGDLPLTAETVDPAALAGSGADIRFACGDRSHPVFREIASELTRIRRRPGSTDPERPDLLEGVGHVVYFAPEPVAAYIRERCAWRVSPKDEPG
jgi:pimeloyl-ACP methyl ester carboxylesterase